MDFVKKTGFFVRRGTAEKERYRKEIYVLSTYCTVSPVPLPSYRSLSEYFTHAREKHSVDNIILIRLFSNSALFLSEYFTVL